MKSFSNTLKSIGSNLIGSPAERDKPSKRHYIYKSTVFINNRRVNTVNPFIVVQILNQEPTEFNIAILSQLNPWIRVSAKIEWMCIGTIDIEDHVSSPPNPKGNHYVRSI